MRCLFLPWKKGGLALSLEILAALVKCVALTEEGKAGISREASLCPGW